MPQAGDLVHLLACERPVAEANVAAVRLIQSGNQVEDGGFARAVRPNQADDFARVDAERQIIDDLQAAKMLGNC